MKEVINKKKEVITEDKSKGKKQDKRVGKTITSSVSISREFSNIIEAYELSPTEVFRRGLAVTLAEMGIEPYNNPLNRERLNKIQDYLKLKEFQDFCQKFEEFNETLKNFENSFFPSA